MSGPENEWKWAALVEIGNTIQISPEAIREIMVNEGLLLIQELQLSRFIVESKERFDQYMQIQAKLIEYIIGNPEVMQDAVRTYFYGIHVTAGF